MSGKPYEVVPRARDCLPLPPNRTTNAIRLGIFGRAQRDDKVTLCNLVCMNNHDHLQLIPKHPRDLPRFYGEVLKKTTDSLRKLTGRSSLRIWEDRVGVMMLASLSDAVDRLVYLFCNPARAGLSDSIDTYRGINSWEAFCSCEASVDARVAVEAPWHRVADLSEIGPRGLSREEDRRYAGELGRSENALKHTVVYEPLAWLGCFGVTGKEEIEAIRQEVIRRVRGREAEYREGRRRAGARVGSAESLGRQAYLKPHVPKRKERKLLLICKDRTSRLSWIAFYEGVEARCRDCYERAKAGGGYPVEWPPGTFVPWLPPTECYQCN